MECFHWDFSWFKVDMCHCERMSGIYHVVRYISNVFRSITPNSLQISPVLDTYCNIMLFLLTKWINVGLLLYKAISVPQIPPQKRVPISPPHCVCVTPSLLLRVTIASPFVIHFPPWHLTLWQGQFAAQSAHCSSTSGVRVLIGQQLIIEPHLTALPGTAHRHWGRHQSTQKCFSSSFLLWNQHYTNNN